MSEGVFIEVNGKPCYTLQDVALQVYGDPLQWKAIAAANGIDHPANIPGGIKNLILPDVETDQDESSD